MTAAIEISRSYNNNLTRIYVGKSLTLWFSYETVVAYAVNGEGTFKSKNIWSQTTAKHLKSIPAHELDYHVFEAQLEALMAKINEVL